MLPAYRARVRSREGAGPSWPGLRTSRLPRPDPVPPGPAGGGGHLRAGRPRRGPAGGLAAPGGPGPGGWRRVRGGGVLGVRTAPLAARCRMALATRGGAASLAWVSGGGRGGGSVTPRGTGGRSASSMPWAWARCRRAFMTGSSERAWAPRKQPTVSTEAPLVDQIHVPTPGRRTWVRSPTWRPWRCPDLSKEFRDDGVGLGPWSGPRPGRAAPGCPGRRRPSCGSPAGSG